MLFTITIGKGDPSVVTTAWDGPSGVHAAPGRSCDGGLGEQGGFGARGRDTLVGSGSDCSLYVEIGGGECGGQDESD